MALSLFLEWSEDRKNKELSKTRHSSQSSTADAARAQALDAILSRNSQNPSYAFEVVLGKIKPSVDNAVRDGVLFQLAGRFAGPDYIPQGGNSDTLLSFVAKLGEAWLALRPQIFQCVQEVSMSRFDELVKRILEYFRYRAVWAKEDFSGVPELAPVVQRIQQQAEEAEALIKGYRARISDGIKTGQVSIAQAHKCWFDLFYPFCKEYGGVAPDDAPTFRQATAPAALAQQWHQPVQHHVAPAYTQFGQAQQQFAPQPQQPHILLANTQHPPSHVVQPQQFAPTRAGRPVVRALAPSLGHGASTLGLGAPSQGQGAPSSGQAVGFVGLPVSLGVVGPALATFAPPRDGCQICSGNHWKFECPIAYFTRFHEPCPGFDRHGHPISNAWHNGEITAPTKVAWRSYRFLSCAACCLLTSGGAGSGFGVGAPVHCR